MPWGFSSLDRYLLRLAAFVKYIRRGERPFAPTECVCPTEMEIAICRVNTAKTMKISREHPTFTNCPQTGSLGLHKQSLPPQAGIKSAQADFVSIAAISNRHVFLQKWDAPNQSPGAPDC